jgi:hypothetical protein
MNDKPVKVIFRASSRVGRVVSIQPYDCGERDGPEHGDIVVSYSEKTEAYGTVYRVVSSRLMRSTTQGRYSLRCEVLGKYEQVQDGVAPGAQVFLLLWYPRKRKRPQR